MAAKLLTTLRRIAVCVSAPLLFGVCLAGTAAGQGSAPLVVASAPSGLAHPTGWGVIQQTAITKNGDWLVEEYPDGGLFEFPANGGPMVTLVPLTGIGTKGGYQNPLVLLDPAQNLYLGGNWNNCLLEFPYDAATNSWPTLSMLTASNNSPSYCGTTPPTLAQYSIFGFSPYYFQPWGIALGTNNNLIVGSQNSGNFIFSMAVQGAWSNPSVTASSSSTSEIISGMTKRPNSIASDPEGNIYFVEDSGGLPGVYEIPASVVAGGTAAALTSDAGLTRVDPNLPSVTAVVTDAQGNLYISDSTQGVYFVPNPSGTPDTADAYLLTSVPAVGEVSLDPARHILYLPTSQTQSNGQADVAKVGLGYAEFGPSTVGKAATNPSWVSFSFNGDATPDRAVVVENGTSASDFTVTGGTCQMQTAYAANSGCTVTLSMTPHSVGQISAKLLLQKSDPVPSGAPDASDSVTAYSQSANVLTLTASNTLIAGEEVVFAASDKNSPLYPLNGQEFNVLAAGLSAAQFSIGASIIPSGSQTPPSGSASAIATAKVYTTLASIALHGVGQGSIAQISPALQGNIGSNLASPSEVAVDGLGNVYVADPGLGKVLMYPAGSSNAVSVGSGLTSPTGVAIDGAGDVFIADSGAGSVYEIPFMPTGLNNGGGQVTLASGLGNSGLSLAVDGLGNVYVTDPSNKRVVEINAEGINGGLNGSAGVQSETIIASGFTAPSSVAVDSDNNLYVIDGQNLFELVGGTGIPVTLLNNLSAATGVAVDPSGAVYISSGSGTERIPLVNGALTPGNASAVAATVTGPSSVALDSMGNVYLTQASGGSITFVASSGALTLPTPSSLTSSTDATFTVTNSGNSSLAVTGYTSSDEVDFTAADTTSGGCEAGSPIAAGGSCTVDVTFNPGPGEQGPLTSQIGVVSNATNAPLTVTANGVGLTLSNSTTVGKPGTAPEVVNTPISVAVAPQGSTGTTPTGTATVTYETWTVVSVNGVPTIKPISNSVTANLVNGQAVFTLAPVLAGSQSIVVNYSGDRVYGKSTTTIAMSIAKSQVTGLTITDPNAPSYLPFVLESGNISGSIPYDGSQSYWDYSMPVKVNTAAGIPTGTLTFMDDSSTCPPGTSATGQGAAICALANYKGVACPTSAGSAIVNIANDGTSPTGAAASPAFATGCLQMPQNTTYTPVISTHWITPVYSGDANFQGFTGTQGTLFQALRSPEVLITASPSSLSVAKGSSVSANLTITSLLGYGFAGTNGQLNDYNFPVSLTCDNLPPHAVCTFSYPSTVSPAQPSAPNSVQIPCVGTTGSADDCQQGQVQITVNTSVTVGTTTSSNATAASVTLASLFGLGMIGLFIRRRAFQKHRLMLMGLMVVLGCALAVCTTACNTTNLSPNAVLSTPPGTYNVTVTAQQVGYQCVSSGPVGSNCTTSSGGTGISVYGSQNQVSVPFYIPVTIQ